VYFHVSLKSHQRSHDSTAQAEIKRLSDRITADVGNIFNLLMNTNKNLLEEVALALPSIRGEEEEEPEEDADEAAETPLAIE